jgi:magnesium transporter
MEWHNILDPHSPELDLLAERYGLHPLHIEDCRHHRQSAKIEEDGYIFTVLKSVTLGGDDGFDAGDLDIFLGRDFIITVLEEEHPELRDMIDQLRRGLAPDSRPDQVYYRIIDRVSDSYLPILDHFAETIDSLEDQALETPTPETLATVFRTKRALIMLRRVFVNTRDVAGHLQRSESPLIAHDLWPFLRDFYDHVARNLDTIEILRDVLNGTLDVYLSSVANRTNQVMKVLTVLGTVALPALVIAGIYGMNLKGLPGEESPIGTLVVVLAMVASTALLLYFLKRRNWF